MGKHADFLSSMTFHVVKINRFTLFSAQVAEEFIQIADAAGRYRFDCSNG